MIPKIIHFCWFGGKNYSPLILNCLATWERFHPDWKIMKWDESNAPISHPFLKKALKDKQYAFASDYTRIYALKMYGGVYLDTDVEVLKCFNTLLESDFFISYENIDKTLIGTAVIGSIPNHKILNDIIKWYDNNLYYLANPQIITPIIENYKCILPKIRCLEHDYFYPYNIYDSNQPVKQLMYSSITKNTFAIHHWAYSWKTNIFIRFIRYIEKLIRR